jgi:hypothetical protein
MFGSYSPILDNSAPLWFATYDDVQSLTLTTHFGGYAILRNINPFLFLIYIFSRWTSAVGKQYTDKSASGLFDLNVFAH